MSNSVFSVAFGSGGRMLAVGGSDTVGVWDTATGKFAFGQDTGSDAISVAFSPSGQTLAVGFGDGTLGLWNTVTGHQIASVPDGTSITGVAFSPDGRTLAVGDGDGDLTLWNTATRQSTAVLAESSAVSSLAFSPDGQKLAIAQDDNVELLSQDFINLPADAMEKLICGKVRENMTPSEWATDASGNYQQTCPAYP